MQVTAAVTANPVMTMIERLLAEPALSHDRQHRLFPDSSGAAGGMA
ncbi:hypothetical protein DAQ1742_04148 [Dickeya aquatica]|uniref:Uncharacterized protein n=1 Tax=Dickeya aquatica TaxID=1401087 RepID=A0A375AFQ1_9GAMM|nr:hypothetical protein DAQ1742_04148 [Dickeya aquatica]